MGDGIDDVKRAMEIYVTGDDLQGVVDQILVKADKDQLAILGQRVEDECVKNDKHLELAEETEYKFEEVHNMIATKTAIKDFEAAQAEINSKIDENYSKTSLIKDCGKDKKELQQ